MQDWLRFDDVIKINALEKQAWDKGESLGKSSEPYKELKIEKENPELY